jgi:peptidyl-prolyl cis-trans isomerase SurA
MINRPRRNYVRAAVCSRFCQILSLFILLATPALAEVVDRVVAEVNDDVITLSEVEEAGKDIFRRIALEVPAQDRLKAIEQVRADILTNLIDKRLIEQEAAKQGIVVTDEEVDQAFEQVLRTNNLSRGDFLRQLEDNGIDEAQYRDNLKTQIYQNKLLNRDVRSKIVITEEAILDYYDTTYTKQIPEGGYYLLQIGIDWGETEGIDLDPAELEQRKQAARQRADRVHKLAVSGNDFRELARKFSDLPSAAEGGDIGVFEEDEMASYMRDAVTSLKPGDVSRIIETPVGFQFFKLLSSKEGGIVMQAPYGEVKEEIREKMYGEALRTEFEAWIKDIRENAYIRTSL